jgi:hypothetical protein
MKLIRQEPLNSAILFLTFNRLETTKRVFKVIRDIKPAKLYVASDGARKNKEGESETVQQVRNYVLHNIDWKCDIKTLFRQENLGCKYAVFSAMKWFFENEEMGIILEDDCLPNHSFFWYCEELLEKYKDEHRIGMISGRNDLDGYKESSGHSYFFSSRGLIWGWATWRRVFDTFDVELGTTKSPVKVWDLAKSSTSIIEFLYRRRHLQQIRSQEINTWDYSWNLNLLLKQQLSIIPVHNMVKNIGFDENATHTCKVKVDSIATHELSFPCFSNQNIIVDSKFNRQLILLKNKGLLRFLVASFSPLRNVKFFLKKNKNFFKSSLNGMT